jgi:HSP20 family protein
MAIIRWNPWSIDRFFEDDVDLPTLPGLSRLVGQGLNLYETDDQVVAEAALPGIPEENIDITIDDNVVRVSGSYQEKDEDRNKKRFYMSNMSQSYNYTFRIPKDIVADKEPVCEYDNGVLKMSFQKVEKQAPKKIKVSKKSKESK